MASNMGEKLSMSAALWTPEEAAAAIDAELSGHWMQPITGLSTDSRSLAQGDLFIALPHKRDGHDFLRGAFAKGASGALVLRRPEEISPDAPLLRVNDSTLDALTRLARASRARVKNTKIIGVTGSAGKTTVKEMLRHVGSAAMGDGGDVHAAEKSFNNHIGVPLTLACMPARTRLGVFEIGMNHPGEIASLTVLVKPDVAIVTTVAPAHLEAFESVDAIADEKISIACGTAENGVIVLNRDIPQFKRMTTQVGNREIIDFGRSAKAAKLVAVHIDQDRQIVSAHILGAAHRFALTAPGAHLAMNAVCCLAALASTGLDISTALHSLETWRPPNGRGDRVRLALPNGDTFFLVDESYNANPASVRAALAALNHTKAAGSGKKIVFLTDMLELGEDAEALHAGLAQAVIDAEITQLHVAGPYMQALHKALPEKFRGQAHATAEDLASEAASLIRAEDMVMVKGSRGSAAHKIAQALRDSSATQQ
jgi:UDP-N-acetylmuramoyl-tripeptide--D-alanyl-D-alanine ligase